VEMCAFFFTKERFSSSIHEPPSTSLYRGGGGVSIEMIHGEWQACFAGLMMIDRETRWS
jgi:hypothetical protein